MLYELVIDILLSKEFCFSKVSDYFINLHSSFIIKICMLKRLEKEYIIYKTK